MVSSPQPSRSWPLAITLISAFLILTASLVATSSWVEPSAGPGLANLIYVLVRVSVLVGLGYLLSAVHQRSAFSTLSLVSLVIFLDQVPLKSWVFLREQQLDPAGAERLPAPALIVGFVIAYGLSLPIVFAFALGGRLLHQTLAKRFGSI